MGSADRIACRIDASAANLSRGEFAHRSNEVTSTIVDW
jgi:hypothetical protein